MNMNNYTFYLQLFKKESSQKRSMLPYWGNLIAPSEGEGVKLTTVYHLK